MAPSEALEERSQHRAKSFGIFRHHEVAGIELDQLRVRNLRLNAACDRRCRDIVFCSHDHKCQRNDLADLSMDIGLGHTGQGQ